MARYMITGGAGFLGINMVRYLLERDHEVVSLDIAPFDYPERSQITEVTGDIRDRAAVDKAMEGVDVVIHTAAALPLYKPEEIYSTDIDGSRNVIESAHAHGVERFIHISSTAVYGIPDHHPLFEDDKLDGVGPYGESKIAAEEVCFEYREKGMIVPVIRPKSFIGPERLGVFALLYDWAYTGHNFPVLGSGNNRYQLLDVSSGGKGGGAEFKPAYLRIHASDRIDLNGVSLEKTDMAERFAALGSNDNALVAIWSGPEADVQDVVDVMSAARQSGLKTVLVTGK